MTRVLRHRLGRSIGGFAIAVVLAGCLAEEALPPAGESKVSAQEASCVADGGRWGEAGSSGLMICYQPTKDANQSCTRDADCTGFCLARSRTCAPFTPLYGCNEVLGASGTASTVCVQ